jgi:serine/threonine-protein kinase
MALVPGTRLGPYEIQSPLGAGGMGEVYRGRDTRLDRTVAIKILPTHLATSEAIDRFDREARAISSLNHPNICQLYDVGSQDGTSYLVMEFLQGETLADRLCRGPLPLEQFLKTAIEICEGLEKAHRSGVVHRDLKPGNIMLTASGTKLMDFGLAKALSTPTAKASGLTVTLSTPAASQPLTVQGTVVGTFQYMSPEQLEGKDADARSDMFALGAVLYEMLTGRRAFEGKSALSVASAIIEKDPEPITAKKPMTPRALDGAIRRALAKDPEERWQMARDLALELKWIANEGSQGSAKPSSDSLSKWRKGLPWGISAVLAIIAVAFAIGFMRRAPEPEQTVRLTADIGADVKLYNLLGVSAVLSPNGTRLAFVAIDSEGKRHLYVRSLDQLQATLLPGTDDAESPFFSPDSEWLGFFANSKLKKIAVQGGAAVALCDAPDGRGGTWSENGIIAFSPSLRTPLSKVSAAGGPSEPLTTLDQQAGEVTQRWPQFLPGGDTVLFTSDTHGGNYEDADIVVYSLSSGQRKRLVQGGYYGRYLPSGHIVYMHEGTMFAVPFDRKRLQVNGSPTPILEGIAANPGDATMQVSFAANGTLMYVPGHSGFQLVSVYWLDREGKFTPVRETPGDYYMPALSPDGKLLALSINDGKKSDLWVYDLSRDTLTRLTFDGNNVAPVWTPDGQRITYSHFAQPTGHGDIFWIRVDGTGTPFRLTSLNSRTFGSSWHPNGKVLAFDQAEAGALAHPLAGPGTYNTFIITVGGSDKQGWTTSEAKPLLTGPSMQWESSFSPDGKWLAYDSNESGEYEVYVRPFPGQGGRWQISTAHGRYPKWSRTSKELFYRTLDSKIMVVPYTVSGESFNAGKPELWSPGQFTERLGSVNFDIHPDGKRFVVLKAPTSKEGAAPGKFIFVFNFFEELRRKAPSIK